MRLLRMGLKGVPGVILPVPGLLQIIDDEAACRRMQRNIAHLAALAGNLEMGDLRRSCLKSFTLSLHSFREARAWIDGDAPSFPVQRNKNSSVSFYECDVPNSISR